MNGMTPALTSTLNTPVINQQSMMASHALITTKQVRAVGERKIGARRSVTNVKKNEPPGT